MKFWTRKEDQILVLLRSEGLTFPEISAGMFHRSKKSASGRLRILQRTQDIL